MQSIYQSINLFQLSIIIQHLILTFYIHCISNMKIYKDAITIYTIQIFSFLRNLFCLRSIAHIIFIFIATKKLISIQSIISIAFLTALHEFNSLMLELKLFHIFGNITFGNFSKDLHNIL